MLLLWLSFVGQELIIELLLSYLAPGEKFFDFLNMPDNLLRYMVIISINDFK